MKKIIVGLIILGIIIGNIQTQEKKEEEVNGVFISYIELQEYIKDKTKEVGENNIKKIIQNLKKIKANTIILQVRPSCDAIYESKIYPYSQYVTPIAGEKNYDVLKIFLEEAHQNHIKIIAWINPYRIRTTDDIDSIPINSPAYTYKGTDSIYQKNGIYWNPAKEEVTNLIVEGVKELLEYDIDGVLMDDYFYPDSEIDKNDYTNYQITHPDVTREEYHFENINQMVKKVHTECQKKKIDFGISPDGNIENNMEKHYADVKKWMREDGYIDFIMPQIYYGFYNSTKAYYKVLKEWESLLVNDKINFYVALAFYKVGREDQYASSGAREWLDNNNIIMREVILSRNSKNYKGFSLFRYDNIFQEESYTKNSLSELENLKKIVK